MAFSQSFVDRIRGVRAACEPPAAVEPAVVEEPQAAEPQPDALDEPNDDLQHTATVDDIEEGSNSEPSPEVLTERRSTQQQRDALASELGTHSPPEDFVVSMRELALRSTFSFATTVCQMADLDPAFHGAMCAWIERPSRFKCGLAPRGSLKSSCWTVADLLRLATQDPHTEILIVNSAEDNIVKWIGQMQNVVQSPLYRLLFPECVPDPRSVRWNRMALELQRTRPVPQATIEGTGIGGAKASNHYRVIHNDDLLDEKVLKEPHRVDDAIRHRTLCDSLLVSPADDSIRDVATKWGMKDYIDWLLTTSGSDLDFIRFAIRKPDGTSVWPARFDEVTIARLRKQYGAQLFALLYMNESLASGATEWDPRCLRYYHTSGDEIVLERPANEGGAKRVKLDTITRWQVVDPGLTRDSTSSRSANVVVGLVPPPHDQPDNFDIVLLEADAHATAPDATIRRTAELAEQWKPSVVGVEVFGGFLNFFYWCVEKYPKLPWRKLKTDTKGNAKLSRIRSFYPLVERGRFYISREHLDFIDEYTAFPNGRTCDLLDALGYTPSIWAPPVPEADPDDPNPWLTEWMRDGSEGGDSMRKYRGVNARCRY